MELKRTFYDFLVTWKDERVRQCLLVNGARQIGKTYIIEKFGRENYESFIEINFALDPQCIDIFEGSLDVRSICERLTAIRTDVRIVPGRTLLFLDEIQDCPNARTAFKPLALDGTFDVIASGSLLGIKHKKNRLKKTPRSVPVGFERQVVMHSLSFAEYLEARGYSQDSLALVKRCFERRERVPDAVNERFRSLFREYAVIGGMPAVVSAFMDRGHYGEVQTLQESLVADYLVSQRYRQALWHSRHFTIESTSSKRRHILRYGEPATIDRNLCAIICSCLCQIISNDIVFNRKIVVHNAILNLVDCLIC